MLAGEPLGVAKRIESGVRQVDGQTVHDEDQMPFSRVKGAGTAGSAASRLSPSSQILRWIAIERRQRYPF